MSINPLRTTYLTVRLLVIRPVTNIYPADRDFLAIPEGLFE
jgi:hypothetical protein